MASDRANFAEKFRVEELTVAANARWVWSVRPGQCTLGAGVLSARQDAARLGAMPPEVGGDLIAMACVVEAAIQRLFAHDKINYLMLMMVDPHVHFHVLPRYSRTIEFAGQSWSDAGWPGPPVLDGGAVDDRTLAAIRDALRQQVG